MTERVTQLVDAARSVPIDEVPLEVAAPLAVFVVVALRWHYGSLFLRLRYVHAWNAVRRLLLPILSRAVLRGLAENNATEEEHVADFDASVDELIARIQDASDRDFEVSVLAGLKTDWEGNPEEASIVGYEGPKLVPSAPDWLRADQVHVFMFRLPDSKTRVCAHYEANSFRPDRWKDHLIKGPTYSPERGVEAVETWLAEADA